ncbi:hypothetical protein [Lapillicoccus jejuensis]|uniref:Uncharacterized protein n=1 Tax=Lapillicoccus jejuensis TaxID=402171 RepID=A0A542E6A3_9MICO|nr:hypothetical protein [Lapillicoccus jejuensis]TQJ10796.1 hypothetical protein FB458_3937 [Lapillicoccus jejuensis]
MPFRLPFTRRGAPAAREPGRSATVPPEVRRAVEGPSGEKVLAAARDVETGVWLVAGATHLSLVDPGAVAESGELAVTWSRPWHTVDTGSWQRESSRLTVTWADGSRPGQWGLGEEALFLQVLRERVQASVVLTEELRLTGRRTGRAVVRQDLATGELLEQVVLGRSTREDAETRAAADEALARLREQVGMPPGGAGR